MTISKIYIDFDDTLTDFRLGLDEMCRLDPPLKENESLESRKEEIWKAIQETDHFYRRLKVSEPGIKILEDLYDEFGENVEILAVVPDFLNMDRNVILREKTIESDESSEIENSSERTDSSVLEDSSKFDTEMSEIKNSIREDAEEKTTLSIQQDILTWVEDHIQYPVKVRFVESEEQKLGRFKEDGDLLIDACKETVDAWIKKGGIGIWYQISLPGQTEQELDYLLRDWDCPYCGEKRIHGKHCPNCGREKPKTTLVWDCLECGISGLVSEYCPNCGSKRTIEEEWDCDCGNRNNTKSYCPNCGKRNPNLKEDELKCRKGHSNIASPFCPQCGKAIKRFKKNQQNRVEEGKYIKFGRYYTENEGKKSPIEWLVLEVKGEQAFLVSRYALDSATFNTKAADNAWGNSTLRNWLNRTFYRKAFGFFQRRRIVSMKAVTERNPDYNTKAGRKTKEKVTLLSIAEVGRYFKSEMEAKCESTVYARSHQSGKAQFASLLPASACWWLRSPGFSSKDAARIYEGGGIDSIGKNVQKNSAYVRPAIWIKIKKK